jgi:uncharacterized protein (DUF58 family)
MNLTTAEILKKVRRIEIKTRGLTNHIFSGEYHSAFKGRGMSFSEVREYAFGDDVRDIDWNVTARFSHPFVKVFEEERELNVMLLIDVSASSLFGTQKQTKRELITEVAATIAFSAITNNDKVGVIFFSDKIEKYIPPKKGKSHILRIIREMITLEAAGGQETRVGEALRYLNNMMKKRSIVFLLSDFISQPFQDALNIASKRHDVVGLQVYDRRDREMADVGLMEVEDAETGQRMLIDTGSKQLQQQYLQRFDAYQHTAKQSFIKAGAGLLGIRTDEDYVKVLQSFFLQRA